MTTNLIKKLKERGLISQITNEKALTKRLAQGSILLYCGFDPTAESLHLGHLVPLLCMKMFQNAGHKPIVLIGGGTGLIGDPSFKARERKLNTTDQVNEWFKKIYDQIAIFLDFNGGYNSAIIVNNYTWLSKMSVLDFLRIVGKHFTINQLVNKEAVKQRFNRDEIGISFTEFAYNLLQSYDFACLNTQYGVELQIGGSDQWGNITSGIYLTRKLHQKKVFGITLPLITKANGIKFGKTESDTIWLNAKKTSPYKFYQFWINTADVDVYRFLKLLTFLDIQIISRLEEEDQTRTHNNTTTPRAQFILAEQVTRMVHGATGLAAAKRITQSLFYGTISKMKEADFSQLAQDGIPAIELVEPADLLQVLVNAQLVSSRSQARSLISAGAITINGKKNQDTKYHLSSVDKLCGRYTLLRRGKKNYCLVCWKS
ncbi:MAG: tyrosine--tRNA ligase [Candidatus Dasytiphilus stammeri]